MRQPSADSARPRRRSRPRPPLLGRTRRGDDGLRLRLLGRLLRRLGSRESLRQPRRARLRPHRPALLRRQCRRPGDRHQARRERQRGQLPRRPEPRRSKASWIYGSISAEDVRVDQFGGANDGNVYVSAGTFQGAFDAEGNVASRHRAVHGLRAHRRLPGRRERYSSRGGSFALYSKEGQELSSVTGRPSRPRAGKKAAGIHAPAVPFTTAPGAIYATPVNRAKGRSPSTTRPPASSSTR